MSTQGHSVTAGGWLLTAERAPGFPWIPDSTPLAFTGVRQRTSLFLKHKQTGVTQPWLCPLQHTLWTWHIQSETMLPNFIHSSQFHSVLHL